MDTHLKKKLEWRWLHCLRNIHTTNELRQASAMVADIGDLAHEYGNVAFKLLPRGSRRAPKRLPTAWEDIPVSLWCNSAWSRMWWDKYYRL